ncbi:MAG: hypothetical protein ABSF95_01410 [Verrucomicrobiota bacterium]|jgi:DNA-binding transcriptional regulator GbsR (MarR family)
MLAAAQKETAKNSSAHKPAARLSPLEMEVIGLFVQLARSWGRPTSLAETYGLLFVSSRSLAVEDFVERLGLSRGAAYQDLNFLRSVGAVKIVYATGDRRTHYQAVAELRNLVIRFLHEKLIAHLDTSRARLERIAGLVKQLPPDERARLTGRVKTLQSWENNVRRFLPRLARMLAK